MAQDKEMVCKDCGQPYVFTAGEQEFYQSRGFSEPVRCKACRDIKKSQKQGRDSGSGFSRGSRNKY